jgi:UPF0716 protein FxsA
MPLLLFALFIVVPIVELYVIIQVGQAIGIWWTLLLLIADSVLGTWLMRSQGRAAWRRFNETMAAGRMPAREILDGALIIFGGAFLLAPGFITDAFGLFFLIPPTRALARRVLVRTFAGRFMVVGRAWQPPPQRPHDVDGTAHDVDADPPLLP